MKTSTIAILSFFGIFVIIGIMGFGLYVSNYNKANRIEKQLVYEDQNKNQILANYGKKVLEMVQVADMYKDGLKEVVTGAMSGRYGQNGSKAVFQWIKEHDINLDSSVYKQIQVAIEGGRDKFENAQSKMLDTKRQYETALDNFWGGMMMSWAGYPKVDLNSFQAIISERAAEAAETHREEALKLH